MARQFAALLEREKPQAVLVFNGQFFPEATARWVAQQYEIPVITHEVGLRPFTAFFTPGEATAYPLHVPEAFELDERQNARLDEYLSQRFKGQFSMAGVRFWPEMKGLDPAFLQRIEQFQQVVPVFTNVIFDTSQPHSNVVFPHMFAWLDLVLELARSHPETLFVLRAHPDESRPGKASQESVRQWVERSGADGLPNLIFIDFAPGAKLVRADPALEIYHDLQFHHRAGSLAAWRAGAVRGASAFHPAADRLLPPHARGLPPAGRAIPVPLRQSPYHQSSPVTRGVSYTTSYTIPRCPSGISWKRTASGQALCA